MQAGTGSTCEVPLVGTVDVPTAVLVRPDGHVAWAGEVRRLAPASDG